MKNKTTTLLAVSAMVLGLTSCMYESELCKRPGAYYKNQHSTDANGTTTDQQTSTNVRVDKQGHKTVVVKSKTTKDPKGLMNKTTTSSSKETVEEN